MTGANLLILPTDVLKTISTLFRSKEWARGPSLTCRLLNKLSLPCIDVWAYLHLPLWKVTLYFTPLSMTLVDLKIKDMLH